MGAKFGGGGGGGSAAGTTVVVRGSDAPSVVKAKLEALNAEQVPTSPQGMGNLVEFEPRGTSCGPVALSTMQSIKGTAGSSIHSFDITGVGAGQTGQFILQNDSRARRGIRGNGVIEDMFFDGRRQDWEVNGDTRIVHGYHAPDRAGNEKCIAHTMRNTQLFNFNGIGVDIGKGNDQYVAERVRVEGCGSWAMRLASSDNKLEDLGLTSDGGALFIDGAAVEINTIDMYMPATFKGECTLLGLDAQRVQIHGGTVEGRAIFRGRNDQGVTNRYENAKIRLSNLTFKHAPALNSSPGYSGGSPLYVYDSYYEAEDIDGTTLDGCSWGFDPALDPALLPAYLIGISTATGVAARRGKVMVLNAGGMIGVWGREGEAIKQRLGCKKHFARFPKLVQFDWGVAGIPVPMPLWAVDVADPTQRLYVRCDGATYNKADLPFGYLCATIDQTIGGENHGTLDDPNTTFTVPNRPLIDTNVCWALRVVP